MSLPKGRGRVEASDGTSPKGKSTKPAAEIQKLLLKIGPLPPLSALHGMSAAERAKVKELAALHRETTAAHFAAKREAEAAKKPPEAKQGHVEDEDEDDLDSEAEDEDEDEDETEDDKEVEEVSEEDDEEVDADDEDDDDETEDDNEADDVPVGPKHKKNSFEASRFQSRPGRKQFGLFTPAWCDFVTRNLAEARVLGQLAHWFGVSDQKRKCRAKIVDDGFLWIYKHYPALARETRLSKKQVADAVRNLIAQGIVVTREDAEHGRLLPAIPGEWNSA